MTKLLQLLGAVLLLAALIGIVAFLLEWVCVNSCY